MPRLSKVWQRCLEYTKQGDFESAYRLMLNEGDDMYLLRLMVQTGPVLRHLNQTSFQTVIQRLNKIVRTGIFEMIEIEWVDDAKRTGHFEQMALQDQNEFLDTLY